MVSILFVKRILLCDSTVLALYLILESDDGYAVGEWFYVTWSVLRPDRCPQATLTFRISGQAVSG